MKKYWSLFMLAALLFASCQDLLMVEETLEAQQEVLELSAAADFSLLAKVQAKEANAGAYFPELTLKKNKSGEVKLKVRDRNICQLSSECKSSGCPISVLPDKCRPNGRITLKSAACNDCPSETVTLVFDKIEMSTYSISLPAGSPTLFEKIVNVNVVYSGLADTKETTYNYNVFVFADGTTALHSPAFGGSHGGVSIALGDLSGDGVNYLAQGNVIVKNDPAFEVATVKVTFNEPFGGSAPLTTSYMADCGTCQSGRTFQDRSYVFDVKFAPGQNPAGSTYSITTTMLNAKGEVVGQSLTTESVVQKSDFTGRIKRVRVRESGEGSNEYKIIGTVEGDSKGEVASLDIRFKDTFLGTPPIPSQVIATLRNINPENGNKRFVFDPLVFEGGARPVGETYTVLATMLDAQGRPMANAAELNVVVEGNDLAEPVLMGTTLTSEDGGATWDITVILQDKGNWVEKVVYEFIKPYNGPAPFVNPITLVRTGEAPDGVETYTASGIKFEGDPTDITYTAIVYQYGTGTRSTATQANSKAELL